MRVVFRRGAISGKSPSLVHSGSALGLPHASGHVAPGVKHAPDVDVVDTLSVEHEIGIILRRPTAQSRDGELVRVTGRPDRGTFGDRPIGGLKRVDEAKRDVRARLAEVEVNRRFDVSTGELARDDPLPAHSPSARRTRSLRPVK